VVVIIILLLLGLVGVRKAIGISNVKVIPDNSLTSSSIYNNTISAGKARLLSNSSWRPRDNDTNPWLQIDLGEIYYVCAVATQGDPNSDERTRKYKIKWSLDGVKWEYLKTETLNKVTV
jgi:hypothetical protein